MMFLQKEFIEKYSFWFAHGELYVSCETMVERIVGYTSNFINVHGFVGENCNPHMNIIMNAMRMN